MRDILMSLCKDSVIFNTLSVVSAVLLFAFMFYRYMCASHSKKMFNRTIVEVEGLLLSSVAFFYVICNYIYLCLLPSATFKIDVVVINSLIYIYFFDSPYVDMLFAKKCNIEEKEKVVISTLAKIKFLASLILFVFITFTIFFTLVIIPRYELSLTYSLTVLVFCLSVIFLIIQYLNNNFYNKDAKIHKAAINVTKIIAVLSLLALMSLSLIESLALGKMVAYVLLPFLSVLLSGTRRKLLVFQKSLKDVLYGFAEES